MKHLLNLWNIFLTKFIVTEKTQLLIKKVFVVVLWKGSKLDCWNCQHINLLSHVHKLFILQKQTANQSGRSTNKEIQMDQINKI